MIRATDRERLRLLLDGGTPGQPPHFELAFYLAREMFGMDEEDARLRAYPSDAARSDAIEAFHLEVALRCVEEFGFNSGPFISPDHFREFCVPYMTELVAFMHDHKLPVILHSDGNLNAILGQIHATGVDGYQLTASN